MRRFAVLVRFDPAKGEEAGRRPGTLRFDLTVADLNRRQAIGPPADPRPLSELTAALALLASRQAKAAGASAGGSGAAGADASGGASADASGGAGAGGSSGAGAGGSSGTGGGASGAASAGAAGVAGGSAGGRAATSRYDACLADAGTDLAKVQRCAAFLGQ